jgi:MerR family transcriptional regulator, redox-sensitive transcriptional activator SoxR
VAEAELSIGEVAEQAGINVSAIRFYEREGLLPAAERVGGQRRFTEEAVGRLGIIGVAKRAGFSLEEIRTLLSAADRGSPAHEQLRALSAQKLPEVEALIQQAETMRNWLIAAGACECESLKGCALFRAA